MKHWKEDTGRMRNGEHLWEECRSWREGGAGGWQEVYEKILVDKGEGENWMREVEEERRMGSGVNEVRE